MNQVWNSIRRNPIILAAVAIVAIQVWQDWNHIQDTDYFKYLFSLGVAFLARSFTVPLKDHESTVDKLNQELHPYGGAKHE